MTDLAAHGIEVTLPTGWEGRVFKRPSANEVAATAADGPPAPQGETTHAVLHVSTIALPPGVGDFASGAVDKLGPDDVLIVLFEYDPTSIDQPLFKAEGLSKRLTESDFSPNVLQRNLRGQAGVQRFFHDSGRTFCLYVVLGAYVNRRALGARGEPGPRDTDHRARRRERRAVRLHHDHRRARHVDDCAADQRAAGDHHDERPVSVLAGPFAIAAVLLAVGGVLKAVRPRDTAQALSAIGLRFPSFFPARAAVRVGGAVETMIGVGALLTGGPVFAALVAVSYLVFAAFVSVALLTGAPISSCGCFGKVDTPPSVVHIVINLLAAGVAIGAAVVGDVALPDVLRDQPLLGIPFLLLLVIGCSLVFLAFTSLPKTMAAVREAAA